MLSLFAISQVDAVSVLGTLNRDNGAVPDNQSAAVAAGSTGSGGEWGAVGRSGGGMVSPRAGPVSLRED